MAMSNLEDFICYSSELKHLSTLKILNKMEEFILIFRHEDGQKIASPEQMQIWMKQTMDWIGGIAAQNKFSGGNGLPFDDARVVKHNNIVTNGPFGEIKETIGGYVIVKADSIDEA